MAKSQRRPVVLLVQPVRDDGLEMYAEYLRYSGLAAIAVSNAKDALTFAPGADIIVTGMVLDGKVGGAELVSRLRGDEGTMHKPIIVLTASAWREERERAEHAGCDVFLSKPCLPDALLREVRLLLPTMQARLESGSNGHRRLHAGVSPTSGRKGASRARGAGSSWPSAWPSASWRPDFPQSWRADRPAQASDVSCPEHRPRRGYALSFFRARPW